MENAKVTFKKTIPYKQDEMNMRVENVEAAIPFYENILGFRVSSRNDAPYKIAVLSRDDIQIGLAENGRDPTQDGCVFEVDDVNAALAEINAKCMKKELTDIKVEKHGDTSWRVFYIIAPDGLCYCVGEKEG